MKCRIRIKLQVSFKVKEKSLNKVCYFSKFYLKCMFLNFNYMEAIL